MSAKAKPRATIQDYINNEHIYAEKVNEDIDSIKLELAKGRSFMFGVAAAVLAGIAGEGLIKLIEMISKHYGNWILVVFYSFFFVALLCIGFFIWLTRRKYVSFLRALMHLAESNLQESSARLEEYENERLDESTVARMNTFYNNKVK